MFDSDGQYWYTAAEAAERLHVCAKTVRNWVKTGYLDAHKLGPRKMVISLDAIDAAYRPFGKSYNRTR